jgi:hypothetical protein
MPGPEAVGARRRSSLIAVLTHLLLTAGSLVAIVLAFGLPDVDGPWLISLGALLAVSAVAHAARVRPTAAATFDAGLAVELCALVVVGPLGALVVAFVPLLVSCVVRRDDVLSDKTTGDLAAVALECAVGAGILTAAPASPEAISAIPAIFTAGVAMLFAGYLVGPALLGALHRHRAPEFSPFFQALPAELTVVLVGAVVILFTGLVGDLALLGFVLAVPVPSLLIGELTRFKAADLSDPATARRTYARALADELELPRRERRALEATLDLLAGDSPAHSAASTVDLTEAVLYRGERWDGGGDVAGLSGEWIPRVARVVAVADAWSELTAAGTPALEHDEALLGLATGAGTRFDPVVVRAAERVVEIEGPIAHQPAFLPRLHTVPAPRILRRGVLPRVLQAVAGH